MIDMRYYRVRFHTGISRNDDLHFYVIDILALDREEALYLSEELWHEISNEKIKGTHIKMIPACEDILYYDFTETDPFENPHQGFQVKSLS